MFPSYPKSSHHSGQARIRVKGRDVYLGPFGSEQSKAKYKALAEKHAMGLPVFSKECTVVDLSTAWNKDGVKRYSASSREPKQFSIALTVLCRLYGTHQASQVTPGILETVRESMASGAWLTDEEKAIRTKRRQPCHWSRKVCNRQIGRIKTVWRWAERRGLVPPGSWAHLGTLEPVRKNDARYRNTRSRQPATWEQIAGVLDVVPPVVCAMLETHWQTGMRPGELVKMRVSDLSPGPNDCWVYKLDEHKGAWRENDAGHFILLNSECQRVLGPLVAAAKSRGPQAYLFPPSRKKRNGHYTTAAYSRAIARACEETGVEHFTPVCSLTISSRPSWINWITS